MVHAGKPIVVAGVTLNYSNVLSFLIAIGVVDYLIRVLVLNRMAGFDLSMGPI